MSLLQNLTVEDLQIMKAMLESIPEGQNPNGYFTKERFASVMNATLPSLGSRDDRAQLESLFDQIDTDGVGFVTWSSVCNFIYYVEENLGSSSVVERWELLGPTRMTKALRDKWHQQPVDRIRYCAALDKYFTAGRDSTVKIWQGRSLIFQASLDVGIAAQVTDACFVTGKKTLVASAMDGNFYFFELHRGNFEYRGQMTGHTKDVGIPMCLAYFHKDRTGQHVVLYGDTLGRVGMFLGPYKRMKDPLVEEFKEMQKKDGKQHRKMLDRAPMARVGVEVEIIDDGHRDWVTQIHFCEKSEILISSSRDKTLRVVNMETRRPMAVCRLHTRGVVGFDYSYELGIVASYANERQVIVWVVDGASHLITIKVPTVLTGAAIISATNQLSTLHNDYSVRLFDIRTGAPLQVFESKDMPGLVDSKPTSIVYDASRLRLITCNTRPMPWAYRCVETLTQGHNGPVRTITFSPSFNAIITADENSMVISWDIQTGSVLARIPNAHAPGRVTALAVDSSGRRLLTGGSDGTVLGWNFVSGFQTTRYVDVSEDEVACIEHCVHPLRGSAWVAAGGWRGRLTVWMDDVAADSNVSSKALRGHTADVVTLSYDPGTNLLVSGDASGKILLWHLTTSSRRVQLNHQDFLTPFSGLLFDISCECAVMIPAARSSELARTLDATVPMARGVEGEDSVATVQSALDVGRPDMPMLLTATADGRLLLWMFARTVGARSLFLRSQLNVTSSPMHQVTAIALDASRRRLLAVGDSSGLVLLLDISSLNNGTEAGTSLRCCRKIAHFQAHPSGNPVALLTLCSMPGSEDPSFIAVACRSREPLLFALDGRLVTDISDEARLGNHTPRPKVVKASSQARAMRLDSVEATGSGLHDVFFRIHDESTWMDPDAMHVIPAEAVWSVEQEAVDVDGDGDGDDGEGEGEPLDSEVEEGLSPEASEREGSGQGRPGGRGPTATGQPGSGRGSGLARRGPEGMSIQRAVSNVVLEDIKPGRWRRKGGALAEIEEGDEGGEGTEGGGIEDSASSTAVLEDAASRGRVASRGALGAAGGTSFSERSPLGKGRAGLDAALKVGESGAKVGRRTSERDGKWSSPPRTRAEMIAEARARIPYNPEVERMLERQMQAATVKAERNLAEREARNRGEEAAWRRGEGPLSSAQSRMRVYDITEVPDTIDGVLATVGLNYLTDPVLKAMMVKDGRRRRERGGGDGAGGDGGGEEGRERGAGSGTDGDRRGSVLAELAGVQGGRTRSVEVAMEMDEMLEAMMKKSRAANVPMFERGKQAEVFRRLIMANLKPEHVEEARGIAAVQPRSRRVTRVEGDRDGASSDDD